MAKFVMFKHCYLIHHRQFRSLHKFLCPTFNVSFRPHYGSWVDSVSNRNEYQEYFLWLKRPIRCPGNVTTFIFLFSWNLRASNSRKPLGLSRPVMGMSDLYFTCERRNSVSFVILKQHKIFKFLDSLRGIMCSAIAKYINVSVEMFYLLQYDKYFIHIIFGVFVDIFFHFFRNPISPSVYFVAKLNLKSVVTNMQLCVLKIALSCMSKTYIILLQQFARLAALNGCYLEN
jgi:hypothetical protein